MSNKVTALKARGASVATSPDHVEPTPREPDQLRLTRIADALYFLAYTRPLSRIETDDDEEFQSGRGMVLELLGEAIRAECPEWN